MTIIIIIIIIIVIIIITINPSKMEVAPQGCLNVIYQKTNNKIN